MIWMGNWDSRRDREPDKKDEQAFKEYLRDKYERKKWYKDPNEVKKEIASKNTDTTLTSKPATIPTLPPPVSTFYNLLLIYYCFDRLQPLLSNKFQLLNPNKLHPQLKQMKLV